MHWPSLKWSLAGHSAPASDKNNTSTPAPAAPPSGETPQRTSPPKVENSSIRQRIMRPLKRGGSRSSAPTRAAAGPSPAPAAATPALAAVSMSAVGTESRPEADLNAEETLCNLLHTETETLKSKQKKSPSDSIKTNATGVLCLTGNAVAVERTVPGKAHTVRAYLHANQVELPNTKSVAGARIYLAGQSPSEWETCQNFLVRGIESGQGLFQFVSAQQQADKNREGHAWPILKQLRDKVGQPGHESLIGGRYQIAAMGEHPGSGDGNSPDHTHITLTVIDTRDPKKQEISIPITQAGLPFTKRVLDMTQIQRAAKLFDRHRASRSNTQTSNDADHAQMFVSTAGFGRNATLMTYHDLSQRIDNNEIGTVPEIDAALHAAIMAGRAARGYRFVHSDEQVKMLRRALVAKLDAGKERQPEQAERGEPARASPVQPAPASPPPSALPSPSQPQPQQSALGVGPFAAVPVAVTQVLASSAGHYPAVSNIQVTTGASGSTAETPGAIEPQNATRTNLVNPVRSAAKPVHPGNNASGSPVDSLNEPAPPTSKTNDIAPMRLVVPATNLVTDLPTRSQAGEDLMGILGDFVTNKMQELIEQEKIDPDNRTEEQNAKIAEIKFDIGERLRLQHVLQKFLENPPARRRVNHRRINNAIGKLYQNMDVEVLDDRAVAKANKTPYGDEGATSSSQPHNKTERVVDTVWAKEHWDKSAWTQNNNLVIVENGGADNKSMHDEGNNCLIVSLLQHATGDYANRFHRDMARILREMLVYRYSDVLLKGATKNETAHTASLMHDTDAGKSLVSIINALYGRKLEVHWLNMRRGPDDNVVERLHNLVEAPAGSNPERVLILQIAHHFEAIVTKNDLRASKQKTAFEKAERATAVLIESHTSDKAEKVKISLGKERIEVERLIAAQLVSKIRPISFPLLTSATGLGPDAIDQFKRISAAHHAARCDREIKILKDEFDQRLDRVAMEFGVNWKTLEVEKFQNS